MSQILVDADTRRRAIRAAARNLADMGIGSSVGEIADVAYDGWLVDELVYLTEEQGWEVYADLTRDVLAMLRRSPGASDSGDVEQAELERLGERS